VGAAYEALTREIDRALGFMRAIGAESDELHRVSFHSSHEALILEYEHALTRIDSRTDLPYDVSGHFVWVGERTRQIDGAHVTFASRIRNPIGVKLGPSATPDEALALAAKLNPDNEPGRLTFVTRLSAGKIRDLLPDMVEKVSAAGINTAWVCDPMHGNTITTSSGYKTRKFDDVIDEVRGFFEVHHSLGTWPGGIHVELTGDDVTECVGGGEALDESGLQHRYESVCDPRLNRTQSLELAFLVAEMLRQSRD
jgi:3-deoxy-7-phosphoheptulonate synthase